MASERSVITLATEFAQNDHRAHHDQGLSSYVDIAKELLTLGSLVRSIAGGAVTNTFHTRERSLYEPLKATLERCLPANEMISIENNLYRTTHPKMQTDLSIHSIWHKGTSYKDKSLECSHFIEIKSVFHGETLLASQIDADLEKLIACEASYDATCFFVIVGLSGRLKRSVAASTLLAHDKSIFARRLSTDRTVHLRAAARHETCEPHVAVFQVSAQRTRLEQTRRSGAWYSIFQRR